MICAGRVGLVGGLYASLKDDMIGSLPMVDSIPLHPRPILQAEEPHIEGVEEEHDQDPTGRNQTV